MTSQVSSSVLNNLLYVLVCIVTQPSVIINQEGEPQWHFNHYVCLYIYTVTPNVAIDLPGRYILLLMA